MIKKYLFLQGILFFALIQLTILVFDKSVQNEIPQVFFNSDALVLFDFIKSVQNIESIGKWCLPPSTYFFPDLIVHSILQFFFRTPSYTLAFFAVFQIFAILFSFVYLISILYIEKEVRQSANLIVSICLVIIVFMVLSGKDLSNLQNLLVPGHHAGLIPIILICLGIILDKVTSIKNLILLFLLIGLTAASDKIFLLQFSIPVFLLLFFLDRTPKDKLRLAFLLIFASLAGLKLESLARKHLKFLSHDLFSQVGTNFFESISLSLLDFERWKETFLILTNELSFASLLILFIGIFVLPLLAFRDKTRTQISRALIFISLLTTINTGALILSKYYANAFAARYLLPAFSLPFIFLCIFVFAKKHNPIRLLSLSFSFLAFFITINNMKGQFLRLTNFQPESAKCLDSFYAKFHLTRGASDYWTARPATLFSREAILVYPI